MKLSDAVFCICSWFETRRRKDRCLFPG